MRVDKVVTILRREYRMRIRSKAFWISTLLLPVAIALLIFVPAYLMVRAQATHRLTVVDAVGGVGEELARELAKPPSPTAPNPAEELQSSEARAKAAADSATSRFDVTVIPAKPDATAQAAELDAEVLAGTIGSWIRITPEALAQSHVEYHAESVSSLVTQRRLAEALREVFSRHRLAAQGYDAGTVVKLTRPVDLETLKVTKEGTRAEAGEAGFFLAYGLFFLLYMIVAIYGAMVMNGVLEEKSSRIVEVLLATTTPTELLSGKLLGIGLAGLTQLGVWAAAIAALTAPGVAAAMATGLGVIPQVPPVVLIHLLFEFLLGFFLFASMYAAIGSAANSTQEAQPLTALVAPFLIAPVIFMPMVINDPDSALSVGLSLFPPFTPMLMLLRIAVKMPPVWQVALGYVLTTAFVALMVWLSARIYRTGILMYGKRPTFVELGRWVLRR